MRAIVTGASIGGIGGEICRKLAKDAVARGERALIAACTTGTRPDGTPWRVAIADPDSPGRAGERLALVDRAIATSAGAGFRFDAAGRYNHILDPRSGASATRYRSVSVIAPRPPRPPTRFRPLATS